MLRCGLLLSRPARTPQAGAPRGQGVEQGRPGAHGGRDGVAAAAARRGGGRAGRLQRRSLLPAFRRRARCEFVLFLSILMSSP